MFYVKLAYWVIYRVVSCGKYLWRFFLRSTSNFNNSVNTMNVLLPETSSNSIYYPTSKITRIISFSYCCTLYNLKLIYHSICISTTELLLQGNFYVTISRRLNLFKPTYRFFSQDEDDHCMLYKRLSDMFYHISILRN